MYPRACLERFPGNRAYGEAADNDNLQALAEDRSAGQTSAGDTG
jgi:hypothetical protein